MKKKPYYILGIHQSGPIASVALFSGGELLVACPEERITRIKQDSSFPNAAIQYCLDFANIKIKDIKNIAIGWNPGVNVSLRYRRGFSNENRYPGDWLTSVPNSLLPKYQDMTGRVQTVTKDSNPLLLSVLDNFNELTGVPVILNTSFNLNGEPVVDAIEDALRTYISSGLDALVIGSYVLEK